MGGLQLQSDVRNRRKRSCALPPGETALDVGFLLFG